MTTAAQAPARDTASSASEGLTAPDASSVAAGAAPSRAHIQLRGAVARTGGYEAQSGLLAPVQRHGGGSADEVHEAAARGISGGGGTMPFGSQIQKSFGGYDVSNVHAHIDSAASEANDAMGGRGLRDRSRHRLQGGPRPAHSGA